MDKEFISFMKDYLNNKFEKVVECKEGTMLFDVSTNEKACESKGSQAFVCSDYQSLT